MVDSNLKLTPNGVVGDYSREVADTSSGGLSLNGKGLLSGIVGHRTKAPLGFGAADNNPRFGDARDAAPCVLQL